MAQLDELQGDCPIDRFADAGQYEQAIDVARRCGRPAETANQLAILGRFAEARATLPAGTSPALETGLALAMGDWDAAASGAEAIASKFETREPGPNATDADLRAWALEARCKAALFRWFGGDHGAFARVKGKDGHRRCRAMEALTLPSSQQVDRLLANLDLDDYDERWIGQAIAALNGEDWALRPLAGNERAVWLAPFLPTFATEEARTLTDILRRRLALLTGDFEVAKAGLDISTDTYELAEILFSALVRSGSTIPPRSAWRTVTYTHERYAELRRKSLIAWEGESDRGACIRGGDPALRDAFEGDGAALARRLRSCFLGTYDVETLFTVVSHITRHRAELAEALRFHGGAFAGGVPNLSFEVLEHAAIRRDLARFLGDTAEADRWAAIFARHEAPLTRRDTLIAMLVWTID